MSHENDPEVYPPFRLVAAFADGTRRTFDGLTREQAYQAIVRACDQYGDAIWYDGVTDEHYEHGQYYQLVPRPEPIHLPFVFLDLSEYDGEGIPDDPFVEDEEDDP